MQITLDIKDNYFNTFVNFLETLHYVDVLNQEKRADKAYDVSEIKKIFPNAYEPWTEEQDRKLEFFFQSGKRVEKLSKIFGRNKGAIVSRIQKLGLEKDSDL